MLLSNFSFLQQLSLCFQLQQGCCCLPYQLLCQYQQTLFCLSQLTWENCFSSSLSSSQVFKKGPKPWGFPSVGLTLFHPRTKLLHTFLLWWFSPATFSLESPFQSFSPLLVLNCSFLCQEAYVHIWHTGRKKKWSSFILLLVPYLCISTLTWADATFESYNNWLWEISSSY